MNRIGFPLFLLFVPALALAQVATSTAGLPQVDPADEALGLLSPMLRAFRERDFMMLAALLLTGAVWGLRQLQIGKKIPDTLVPWVTMAVATFTSVAAGLAAKQSLSHVLWTGLAIGVAASGLWESVGKLIRNLIGKLRPAS